MNFSQQTSSTSFSDRQPFSSGDSSSERLRKAIERNRAKQSRRQGMRKSPPDSPFAEDVRRSVGRVEDVEFVSDIRRPKREAPASVGYLQKSKALVRTVVPATASRVKSKKTLEKRGKVVGYLVKVGWLFCLFLMIRLIVSSGGILEYYSKNSTYLRKIDRIAEIEKENFGLRKEINRMLSDHQYQKKLVRDNLGFIDKNEFLILFPEERSPASI